MGQTMTSLREQVEAAIQHDDWCAVKPDFTSFNDGKCDCHVAAVLAIIDAHRCLDRERLARALWNQSEHDCDREMERCAAAIADAYEADDD